MRDMYVIAGLSKQALWKHSKRLEYQAQVARGVVDMIEDTGEN